MAADGSLVHALTLETGLNLSQQGFLAPKESFFYTRSLASLDQV